MGTKTVTLAPLTPDDREQFILDNQVSFRFGAMEEFGRRDDHMEEDGEIISRATIERCIDGEHSEALRILEDGRPVGGAVVKLDPASHHNELELLFVTPHEHRQRGRLPRVAADRRTVSGYRRVGNLHAVF